MSTQRKQSGNKNSNQARAARKPVAPAANGRAGGNGAARPAAVATPPALEQAEKLASAKQARREAELAARNERRAKAQAAAARRRMIRTAIGGALALLLVAAIGVAYMAYQDANPGESFADQGNTHIQLGQTHPAYNSDPPTSGWHTPDLAAWGVHEKMPAVEQLIHNMEDGGVIIYYRPDLDSASVDLLKAMVTTDGNHLVLTPNDSLKDPIVLTAWTRMQRFQSYDEAGIRKFINAYRGIDHHGGGG